MSNENTRSSEIGLYRAKPLDLYTAITDRKYLNNLSREIFFKQVFIVGGTAKIYESDVMTKFLQVLVQHQMKPFAVYIVKNASSKKQISEGAYSHLLFESKLPQFPNIVVKKSDLATKAKGKKFKLLLCRS